MPKRRDLIAMTEDEIWSFVESRQSLQVATLNKDGSPHLTTLWFGMVDGAITFETFTKSQKVVNLKRDPRIAVLLEDGSVYDQLRGVSINGRAVLSDAPEDVEAIAFQVAKRQYPDFGEEQLRGVARMMARKRTAVSIQPERIMSWDHRKLGDVQY